MEYDTIDLVVKLVALGVSLVSVTFAGVQLRRVARSGERTATANELTAKANALSAEANRNANLLAVIALETQLSDARRRVAEASARVITLGDGVENRAALELARMMFNEAGEQYLNVTDRLCACIIRGLVDEATYRRDYRPWIAEVVTKYRNELGPDTRHPNVLRVHLAWADDKPARDPLVQA